jgi:HK97 family phage portal protein
MGILAGVLDDQRSRLAARSESRASLDNPSTPLSLASFLNWLGSGEPTASGEIINVSTALQISDVYSCVRVITEAIGSLPLEVFEVHDDGSREKVDHDLTWMLATEPNDEMSAPTFWESYSGGMALVGNGYAEILRNGRGLPAGLYPLSPNVTTPRRNGRTGVLEYATTSGMENGRERIIAKEDMFHCPLFCLDGLKGLSPVSMARQMLGLARATEKFGSKFFGNGAFPGGILSPDPTMTGQVTDKQKADLKESWERNYGGDNVRRIAVMTAPWKWQSIGLSPEDSQFLGTQQFTRTRIASLFRLNPHQIGDTTRLSGSNAEQLNLDFVINTLRPYLNRVEKEANRKLFARNGPKAYRLEVRFDVSERLRGDFKSTMDGIAVARQWGIFSINDGRRQLGKNPIGKEGDVCMVPVNMQDAARLLDTEPTLDQPLDVDPEADKTKKLPAPKGDDEDDEDDDEGKRSILGRYAMQFGPQFVQAMRNAAGDVAELRRALPAVIEGLALRAASEHPFTVWPEGVVEKIAREASDGSLRRLERKGLPADPDQRFCRDEFRRIVRSVHIQTARECGAIEADRQVADE